MLDAGGLPVLTDNLRHANADNPGGYFEYERVKQLPQDKSWVAGARGQAVKVIYKLAYDLPPDLPYRFLFMQRDLDEVLASQEVMMRRDGIDPDEIGRDVLRDLFQAEIMKFRRWAGTQPNLDILYVDYARVVDAATQVAAEIDAFLGGGLDMTAMAGVVNENLYRNRV